MNKYEKWYNSIILRARNRNWSRASAPSYVERHHIIPKCVGGNNDKTNLVFLTAKEHYIVHLLLTKMYLNNPKAKKSLYAAYKVVTGTYTENGVDFINKRTSRMYQAFRLEISKMLSGEGNPMYGKQQSQKQKDAVSNAMLGKKDSPKTTEKRRLNGLGRTQTEESNEKNRLWHLGRKMPEGFSQKAALAHKGKPQTQKQKASVSRTYKVKYPDGSIHDIFNLNAFCKENQLIRTSLTGNGYKGYQAWRV